MPVTLNRSDAGIGSSTQSGGVTGPIVNSAPHEGAATATFNTPAGTTTYASGDLIANSATAGSVVPMQFLLPNGNGGVIRRARIKTVDSGFSTAAINLDLYLQSPTVANGDNGALSTSESEWVGTIQVNIGKTFTDPLYKGVGLVTGGIAVDRGAVFGLLSIASGSPTPQGAKAWTVVLEVDG